MSHCTAVSMAADYYSRLLRQGLGRRRALEHAVQRYGVTAGSILREVTARHEFEFPVVSSDPHDPVPVNVARAQLDEKLDWMRRVIHGSVV